MIQGFEQTQDTVYSLARCQDACFAARFSGIYRSDDGGRSWSLAYKAPDTDSPLATTTLAALGQNIFAGVKGGILRSSNCGVDWFAAVLPPPAPLISALAISPNFEQDGVLIAGTAEDGVFVSTDRGVQWQPWNFGLLDLAVYAAAFSPHFGNDQTIFIGTQTGIFRSKNGGRAWRSVSFPMDAAPVLSLCPSPDFGRDHRWFAGTEANGLYMSGDNGDTWERIESDHISGAVNAIIIPSASPQELWVLLDDRLVISRDSGQHWTTSSVFSPESPALAVLPGNGQQHPTLVGFANGTILPLEP
ncbi:MAG: hypothetical protein HPY64_10530 [Anaerolineae bacterium]|nr:hypothetical protein [Anaerolineae bacterium]